jgi:putative hemolysin
MSIHRGFLGTLAGLLACGMVASAVAQAPAKNAAPPTTATDYCTSTGGVLENRVPVYGTNGSIQTWLKLGGSEDFCQYTSSADGSRIHLSVNTLYSNKPLLATLAYYAETAWNGQGEGNPASLYCTQLGGSDLFGGINAAGGGWVEMGTIDEVLEACIFPDNSTIDSWGLFYHSAGIIRGTDLSTVLRYANPYPKSKKSGK